MYLVICILFVKKLQFCVISLFFLTISLHSICLNTIKCNSNRVVTLVLTHITISASSSFLPGVILLNILSV